MLGDRFRKVMKIIKQLLIEVYEIKKSQEAYNLLKEYKKEKESFSEVIKRLLKAKKKRKDFLDWLSINRDLTDLADSVESVYTERKDINLRY